MPVPILNTAKIDPHGGQITVNLEFPDTLLLCSYTLDVREAGSNKSVPGFPKQGDNSNPEDDLYTLPDPASANIGRTIWAFITIIDQTGKGGEYCANMETAQDGQRKGLSSTGKKKIVGSTAEETLVTLLI